MYSIKKIVLIIFVILYSSQISFVSFVIPSPTIIKLSTVLPGFQKASPPIEQKIAAIWGKHTASSKETKIPLLFRYFLSCTKYCIYIQILDFNCSSLNFRYFSAQTVVIQNSAIFPLLLAKMGSGTAIKMWPLLEFIFR
jgi:hypothetical protein